MENNHNFNIFLTYNNLSQAYVRFLSILNIVIGKISNTDSLFDLKHLNYFYQKTAQIIMSHPERWNSLIIQYVENLYKLHEYSLQKYYGRDAQPIVIKPQKDKRFKNQEWDEKLQFDIIKQHYFLIVDLFDKTIKEYKDELSDREYKRLYFIMRQFIDAISPSNFPLTNPEVFNDIINSNGENLLKGLDNFMRDAYNSLHAFKISTNDNSAFILGKDIASTEGKVIYQNSLMQLIHYKPKNSKINSIPMLIVPPWINKYYVLDLKPQNSMIKWLVDSNHDVFLISWVNPDKKYAQKKFEDYMKEGIISAVDFIARNYHKHKINITGYCIGGTLTACTLAYMQEKSDNRINSATFLTTLLDYKDAGDMQFFIDEDTIKMIEEHIDNLGVFPADELNAIFSILRANDMVWSFVVNNYLMGKKPNAFDFLYWNADSTSLPAAMQKFYLRNMYLENNLIKPNHIHLNNTPINIGKINVPCYFLGTLEDHIAPWQSVFNGLKHLNTDIRFVLSGSGHVAGVVNPPEKGKYDYYTNQNFDYKNEDHITWFNNAEQKQGSWWSDWQEWLKSFGGKKIDYPQELVDQFAIEDAPGSYVKVRS